MRITECPHCGSEEGYYVMTRVSGRGSFNYNFNGTTHDENGQIHDNLEYKEQKTPYCMDCHKKLNLRVARP